MEYVVITVITTLVGLLIAVMTPIIKLNTAITKLTVHLDNTDEKYEEFKIENSKSHSRMYDKLDVHEKRIVKLEMENVRNEN